MLVYIIKESSYAILRLVSTPPAPPPLATPCPTTSIHPTAVTRITTKARLGTEGSTNLILSSPPGSPLFQVKLFQSKPCSALRI